MSIDYKISTPRTHPRRIDRYDAKIGLFFVGAQDTGEGWWNWWIAFARQGPAVGDHATIDAGGTLSWETARRDIEQALRAVAAGILDELA